MKLNKAGINVSKTKVDFNPGKALSERPQLRFSTRNHGLNTRATKAAATLGDVALEAPPGQFFDGFSDDDVATVSARESRRLKQRFSRNELHNRRHGAITCAMASSAGMVGFGDIKKSMIFCSTEAPFFGFKKFGINVFSHSEKNVKKSRLWNIKSGCNPHEH